MTKEIWAILGVGATVLGVGAAVLMAIWMTWKDVTFQLTDVDGRLGRVEGVVSQLNDRMGRMEGQVAQLNGRMGRVEGVLIAQGKLDPQTAIEDTSAFLKAETGSVH